MKTDQILVGSCYFFQNYPDFVPHDTDYIILTDTNPFPFIKKEKWRRIRMYGKDMRDVLYVQWLTKDEFLTEIGEDDVPSMALGKFLIPEFNELIGLTIEDLPRLQPLVDRIDWRHTYERIIYNAYLENQSFTLTKEQRDAAYEDYKRTREGE